MAINLIYISLILVVKLELEKLLLNLKSKQKFSIIMQSTVLIIFFPVTFICEEICFAVEIFKANQAWKEVDTSEPYDAQSVMGRAIIRNFSKSKISDIRRRYLSVQLEGAVQLVFQKILFFHEFFAYPVREMAYKTRFPGFETVVWIGFTLLHTISIFLSVSTSFSALLGKYEQRWASGTGIPGTEIPGKVPGTDSAGTEISGTAVPVPAHL